MKSGHGSRLRRFLLSSLAAVATTTVTILVLGPRFGLAVGLIGFLGVAWYSDDDLGSCLILAILSVIGFTMLMMGLVGAVLVNT